MEEAGSLEYTRKVMTKLDESICSEIERLGGNSIILKVMDELRNWTKY